MKKNEQSHEALERFKLEFKKQVMQIIDEEWGAILEEVRQGKRSLKPGFTLESVKDAVEPFRNCVGELNEDIGNEPSC